MNEPHPGFTQLSVASELVQWADRYLDPVFTRGRGENAIRRERQRWAKDGGQAPGKVRCPEYRVVDGNLARCPHWYEVEGAGPVHGAGVAS